PLVEEVRVEARLEDLRHLPEGRGAIDHPLGDGEARRASREQLRALLPPVPAPPDLARGHLVRPVAIEGREHVPGVRRGHRKPLSRGSSNSIVELVTRTPSYDKTILLPCLSYGPARI